MKPFFVVGVALAICFSNLSTGNAAAVKIGSENADDIRLYDGGRTNVRYLSAREVESLSGDVFGARSSMIYIVTGGARASEILRARIDAPESGSLAIARVLVSGGGETDATLASLSAAASDVVDPPQIPIPGAAWLMLAGILGLSVARRVARR